MLRSLDVREADRLITALTPSRGKLLFTVRGARRITSRLGGHVDVLNRASLGLAQGHRYDVVTGAESLESFGGIKGDLQRLASAFYLLELTDALLPEASPHPVAYELLLSALRALDKCESSMAVRYAELRLLEDSGYLPELQRCLVCDTEVLPDKHRFAPLLGGVICDRCAVSQGTVMPLSLDALKVLRFFAREDWPAVQRLRIAPALGVELETILATAIHHVLDHELGAADFIEHLRRLRVRAGGAPSP